MSTQSAYHSWWSPMEACMFGFSKYQTTDGKQFVLVSSISRDFLCNKYDEHRIYVGLVSRWVQNYQWKDFEKESPKILA